MYLVTNQPSEVSEMEKLSLSFFPTTVQPSARLRLNTMLFSPRQRSFSTMGTTLLLGLPVEDITDAPHWLLLMEEIQTSLMNEWSSIFKSSNKMPWRSKGSKKRFFFLFLDLFCLFFEINLCNIYLFIIWKWFCSALFSSNYSLCFHSIFPFF